MKKYIGLMLEIFSNLPARGREPEVRNRALLEVAKKKGALVRHRPEVLRNAILLVWARMEFPPTSVEEAAEALIAPDGMGDRTAAALGWSVKNWERSYHWDYHAVDEGRVEPSCTTSHYFAFGQVVEALAYMSQQGLDHCIAHAESVLQGMKA